MTQDAVKGIVPADILEACKDPFGIGQGCGMYASRELESVGRFLELDSQGQELGDGEPCRSGDRGDLVCIVLEIERGAALPAATRKIAAHEVGLLFLGCGGGFHPHDLLLLAVEEVFHVRGLTDQALSREETHDELLLGIG